MVCEPVIYSPESVADCWPTSFSDTGQLSLLSGNHTPAKSYASEPPKDGSPNCTCGKEMSDCSIHPSTPEKWIASMRDSLANLLAMPELEMVQQMFEATYSQKCFAAWKPSNPNISFSKMSRHCSQASPQYAYAAGLIDGEGCLRIHRQEKKSTSTYTPIIQIAMSNKAKLIRSQLVEEFGGKTYDMKTKSEKWADQWMWRINGEEAIRFLAKIYPFLMLKKPQADLLMELHMLKNSMPMQKNGTRAWTSEAKESAAQMKEKMHILNQKGADAQDVGAGWYMEPDLFGTSMQFSGAFPRMGMTVDGSAYAHPMSERRITETGGGYLPTPSGTSNHGKNHVSGRLDEWGGSSNPLRGTEIGKIHCAAFEEWMLGLPIKWTELTELETRKSRSKPQPHGDCSEVAK